MKKSESGFLDGTGQQILDNGVRHRFSGWLRPLRLDSIVTRDKGS